MSNGKPATAGAVRGPQAPARAEGGGHALRDASNSLREPPQAQAPPRRARAHARCCSTVGGVLAMALSEGLRSKVLDLLFGAEEEFDYSSTTASGRVRSGAAPPPRAPAQADAETRCRGWTPQSRRPPRCDSYTVAVDAGSAAHALAARARCRARRPSGSSRRCARSVARRGTAGSTFDHVSREAGVSRGLLHYYFGTKEQLLVGGGAPRLRAAPGAPRTAARRRAGPPTTSSA